MAVEEAGRANLFSMSGRSGSPTLVLLHGLGANSAVWEPLRPIVEQRWRGRWVAPDLRGHGRSPYRPPYGYAVHAADVASLLAQDEEVIILGHSMGGVIAMALATGWFGVRARGVVAFGVKLAWRSEEVDKMVQLARAPARSFDRLEEAVERYLRVSGLTGVIAANSATAGAGVVEDQGRFRVAMDPRAYAVVGPAIEEFIPAVRAPLRLAAGANDPMVTGEQMRRFDPDAVVLDGAGHNPHAEVPERFWQMVEATLERFPIR
jgi:pimeloyl-ACP methyl ester carboxylesterase